MFLDGDTAHRMTDARERRPLKAFAGQKVHAAAGIGDPNRFFLHLGRAGVKVITLRGVDGRTTMAKRGGS